MLNIKNNSSRIVYIDNLRSFMILLVVLIHINVTYSGIGGWYYIENTANDIDIIHKIFSGMFSMFTQAYFMGFMFLIAGYFISINLEKKGIKQFIKGRLFRLGMPLIIYVFIINPIILFIILKQYFGYNNQSFFINYRNYLSSFSFIKGTGPLWFALTLLMFSIIYVLIRKTKLRFPNLFKRLSLNQVIISLILIVTIITFFVRIYFPFGTDVYNLQLCFFTQYIFLFGLGISIGKNNLLDHLTYSFGMKWFKYGLTLGFVFWVIIILLGGALEGKEGLYFGGVYWQSAAYSLFESIICASTILGLTVIFRKFFNKHNLFSKFLADQSFGVYVFHAPILILISYSLREFYIYPILKMVLIMIITLPITYLFTFLVRKNKIMKSIFS